MAEKKLDTTSTIFDYVEDREDSYEDGILLRTNISSIAVFELVRIGLEDPSSENREFAIRELGRRASGIEKLLTKEAELHKQDETN